MKVLYTYTWLFFTMLFACSKGLQPDLTESGGVSEAEQPARDEGELSEDADDSNTVGGASSEDGGLEDEPDVLDPFAPYPDSAEGLVNTSSNLRELLEFGALGGTCDAWPVS
jgi:hypothetical protein